MINKIAPYIKLASRFLALKKLASRKSYLDQTGWFESFRRRMPCDVNGEALPWITYGAIDFLENRINNSLAVFEYGSGNSTIWWSKRVLNIVSCEHDKAWYERMKPKLPLNVQYLQIDLILNGDYSKQILKYDHQFDIVVIDGRDRVNCAKNSITALKDDGVIVFDNSDREKYAEGCDFLVSNGFKRLDFVGMSPFSYRGTSTSIFYRKNNCLGI